MRTRRGFWPILAIALSTLPVAGVFTLSKVFFVRDLTMAFRPRFFFIRHSIFSGVFPLWDPYTAHGQAAINDALYQLFHLPSLLLRLLPSDVLAYNLWVALPVPARDVSEQLMRRGWLARPGDAFVLADAPAARRLRLTVHDLGDADAERLAADIAAAVRAAGGRLVPAGMR